MSQLYPKYGGLHLVHAGSDLPRAIQLVVQTAELSHFRGDVGIICCDRPGVAQRTERLGWIEAPTSGRMFRRPPTMGMGGVEESRFRLGGTRMTAIQEDRHRERRNLLEAAIHPDFSNGNFGEAAV